MRYIRYTYMHAHVYVYSFIHLFMIYHENRSRNWIMHVSSSDYQYCFIVVRGATKSEVKVVGVTGRGETRSHAEVL